MITVLFHMTVKPEHADRFHGLVQEMTRVTRGQDEGCIHYVFHRQKDRPLQYVLYEQWRDARCVDAHLENLCRVIGPARPGTPFPAVMFEMTEKAYAVFYEVVA